MGISNQDEYELKLILPPQALRRLARDPLVRSLAVGKAERSSLKSIYYDTPSRSLQRRGISLRVRRVGQRWIQNVKLPKASRSGLQHVREIEAEVSGAEPEMARIPARTRAQLGAGKQGVLDLEPVFTTTFERRAMILSLPDGEVELALDQGAIEAGDRSLPISEAELELKSGRPDSLYKLALELRPRVPFRLERRSKAARGFGLIDGAAPQAQKSKLPKLRTAMTVAEAFVASAGSCLDQIRANEPVVLEGRDRNGVHQFRVGVRRLRALISAFRPVLPNTAIKALAEDLAWLQRTLGPAREWDVFIAETLQPLRARYSGDASLDQMAISALAARSEAYAQAHDALLGQRYTEFVLNCELALDRGPWAGSGEQEMAAAAQPVADYSCNLIDQRRRKLRKRGSDWASGGEAELHRIRILAKKLRYSIEFFASLYPKAKTRAYLKRVETIQDTLGSLNDALVGQRQLEELEARILRHKQGGKRKAGRSVALVQGWQAARIRDDLGRFDRVWAEFEAAKPFWTKA